ncbi:MAG: hypothetical protein F6K41_19845 [Symploca sp. SIO3E6]|nr:hypothetical protein [Caldora sp. SIO3E6]
MLRKRPYIFSQLFLSLGLGNLSQLLFADGWLFFVPYLLLYLYFKSANLPISTLHDIFIVLHIINLILFLVYLYKNQKRQHIKLTEILFWVFLAILFLQPGAYLEFPADPWEHFRRIFSWSNYSFIEDNPINRKFTYFWGWTLMSQVQPLYRSIALDIYSAFWQLLLAYQFYLLALRLGFDKYWAKVQVVATIFLFGTNLFGFYRYYALSSTPLAYIAYLRSIIVLINAKHGQVKQLALLIPLALIMYYNHLQELLLLIISSIALFVDYITNQKKHIRTILSIVVIIIIIAFLLGTYVVSNPQVIPTIPSSRLTLPYVSQWGTFRIWDFKLAYFETISVHGLISLLLAVLFLSKHKTIAILTLTPSLLMIFPPFVLAFLVVLNRTDNYVTYRILYAFSLNFMLVLGLREILSSLITKLKLYLPRLNLILSVFILTLIISIPPTYPYRGRFWFQVYKPPAELSFKSIDTTAQWFFVNRQLDTKCLLMTDGANDFTLKTHFALRVLTRLNVYNPSESLTSDDALKNYIKHQNICRILVAIPDKVNPPPVSLVGQLSGHWDASLVNKNLMASQEFVKLTDSLMNTGWTKTFVPPFYWLYENPTASGSNNKAKK